MFSVPSKVLENSRTGENFWLRLRFSLICSQIHQNVLLVFHQAMKAMTKCFISKYNSPSSNEGLKLNLTYLGHILR